jgi:hypothetical protein
MNSSKNISVNDVQLGAFYSIYGNNINQYLQDVGRNTAPISCSWSGWDKTIPTSNCTCSIYGVQKSCDQSYNNISCTCVNHIGTKYFCSSGKVTQTAKYWYRDQCADYTFTFTDTGSIGSISVGGISVAVSI